MKIKSLFCTYSLRKITKKTSKAFFNHFFRAWPILIVFSCILFNIAAPDFFRIDYTQFNKVFSIVLQICGGILVLYSIDSNLWAIKNSGVIKMAKDWLKSFPCTRRGSNIYIEAPPSSLTSSGGISRVAVFETNTLAGKIEYLQIQINWLKEDIQKNEKKIYNKIKSVDKKHQNSINEIIKHQKVLKSNIELISVGGSKHQILGALLILHGLITGYFT